MFSIILLFILGSDERNKKKIIQEKVSDMKVEVKTFWHQERIFDVNLGVILRLLCYFECLGLNDEFL